MFNMDTPWLYLYVAHKLHQPQRSTYVATVELTTGKAFTIKGLVVEIFCKDKVSEKEGRIRIYTAATNYLQVSCFIMATLMCLMLFPCAVASSIIQDFTDMFNMDTPCLYLSV